MKFLIGFSFLLAVMTFVQSTSAIPTNPTLMELSTRPWLFELSGKYGKKISSLRDIPLQEFVDLKAKGVDIVWMMGVWHLGPYGLKHDRTDESMISSWKKMIPDFTIEDAIGSPYAPTNYTCNPELCPGGDSDLAWLRQKLHEIGLLLMLDFVPNHSACDSPWIQDPSLYVRAPKGSGPPYDSSKYLSNGIAFGSMPYSSPWTDVAQWNYWNPKTRSLLTDAMLQIASFADAIRCDMAYIVLNDMFQQTWSTDLASWGWSRPSTEFWGDAIKTVRQRYPETKFMAEVYGDYFHTLQDQGFDWTYDKELMDRLHTGNLDNIRGWVGYVGASQRMARFVENHDDNRAIEIFGSEQRSLAAAFATFTLPGLRFFFQDQWKGYANKLDVHLRRGKTESGSQYVEKVYDSLTSIIKDDVFRNGNWNNLQVKGDDSWRLMAWRWDLGTEKRLVVVNFSDKNAGGQVVLDNISGSGQITITELFSNVQYQRYADEIRSSGLTCIVNAWNAQIFSYP